MSEEEELNAIQPTQVNKKCITSWQPDSCGCIVEYSWDRYSDEDTRVHTFHGHSRRCHDHEHLWDEDVYKTVLEENQRKNITLGHAAEHTPIGHTVEVKQPGKQPRSQRHMRPDVNHNFFFTHQGDPFETSHKKPRILHLTFSEKLEGRHKDIIEARFPGLVKVH